MLPLNTARVGVGLWFAKSWTTWNGIFIKAMAGIPDTDSGESSSRGGCSPVRNVKSEAGKLRGDPQGIQAGELPATAHLALLAHRNEPSFSSSGTDDQSESRADPGHRHSHAIRSNDRFEVAVLIPECEAEISSVSNDHAVVANSNQIGEQTTWIVECCPISLRVNESVLRQLPTPEPTK